MPLIHRLLSCIRGFVGVTYLIGLIVALSVFWLGNSGHYTPLLLSLGGVSIALTVFLTHRLGGIDRESAPYVRLWGFITYMPWLFWEIAKSNFAVIQACLKADLDISPALVKVKTNCKSDLAKVTFANSITLTPGTVTVEIEGDKLLVHALYESSAGPGAFDEMDRRSSIAMDGKSKRRTEDS